MGGEASVVCVCWEEWGSRVQEHLRHVLSNYQVCVAYTLGLFCLYQVSFFPYQVSFDTLSNLNQSTKTAQARSRRLTRISDTGKLIALVYQVSFAYILGLFCLYTRFLLPIYQVSFAYILGFFCLCDRSLTLEHFVPVHMPMILALFCLYTRSLLPMQLSFSITRSLLFVHQSFLPIQLSFL